MDAKLIKKCIRGDVEAQTALYNEYAPRMFAVCMRYAPDRSTAEDIMQEGFITVFKKLNSYKGKSELVFWIRRVIINTALQHLRKHNNPRYQFTDISASIHLSSNDADVLTHMSLQEIIALMQRLPNDSREILNLYAIDGYSHKEIGKLLGITEASSKKRLSRARAILRKLVKKSDMITI